MRKIGFALAALVFLGLLVIDSGALLRISGMALAGRFGGRVQIGGFVALAAAVFLTALAFSPRDPAPAVSSKKRPGGTSGDANRKGATMKGEKLAGAKTAAARKPRVKKAAVAGPPAGLADAPMEDVPAASPAAAASAATDASAPKRRTRAPKTGGGTRRKTGAAIETKTSD